MRMRILLVTVIYYILGILARDSASIIPLVIGGLLMPAVLKGWHPRRIRYILIILYAAAAAFGTLRCAQVLEQQQNAISKMSDSDRITVRGIITQKTQRADQISYIVRTSEGNLLIYPKEYTTSYDENNRLLLSVPLDAEVLISGTAEVFESAPNEGNFDMNAYYRSMHIWYRMKQAEIKVVQYPKTGVREALWQLSQRLADIYDANLPGEESGLVSAITLGDKTGLDSEVKRLFQLSGLGHVLAVSGTHITVLSYLIIALLKKLHASRKTQAICGSIICIIYCIMTGMTVSGRRAAIMFVIAMIASASGEAYDSLTAIAVAAFVILLRTPLQLFHFGFRLSFIAAAGVVVIANPMSEQCRNLLKERWNRHHPKEMSRGDHWREKGVDKIILSLVFALAIQLVTLPLVADSYYEIPVYVVLLNTILLPLLPAILVLGLTGGMVGILLLISPYIPLITGLLLFLQKALFYICHCILYVYEFLAAKSLSLPACRWITGKPLAVVIIIYYVFLWAVTHQENIQKQIPGIPRRGLQIGFIVSFLAVLCFPLPHVREITMLDVGQGDGLYFCGGDGRNYMIDGGSTSVDGVGQYRILPFLKSKGIRKIDTWFISHTDLDHCNGLLEALEDHYPIGQIVFSATMEECYREEQDKKTADSSTSYFVNTYSSSGIYEQITALAGEQNISIKVMKKGDVVGTDSMNFTCIYPQSHKTFSGVNENSLVLAARSKDVFMLLGGDIGEDQEKLIAEDTDIGNAEWMILKADHHGSNYSNSAEILEMKDWNQVWISAGKNNRYHHPGKDAVARIKDENIPYICTIYTGQISLKYKNGTWKEYVMKGSTFP